MTNGRTLQKRQNGSKESMKLLLAKPPQYSREKCSDQSFLAEINKNVQVVETGVSCHVCAGDEVKLNV